MTLIHADVTTNGKVVQPDIIAVFVENTQGWVFCFISCFNNYFLAVSRLLIGFFPIGGPIDEILEGDPTIEFGDDNPVVRIPFADN